MKPSFTLFATLLVTYFLLPTNLPAQDGTLDLSFSTDGIAYTHVGDGAYCNDAVMQSDGKIVATGDSHTNGNFVLAALRYNSDGSLDYTFDTDGIATTPYGLYASGSAIVLQNDGKIVVAGYFIDPSNKRQFFLVRFNSNGSLDNTFSVDGIVTTLIGAYCVGNAVAVQSDGKIVVSGYSANGINTDFAVARYNPDGSLDNSFDSDGIVTTPIGSGFDESHGMVLQIDGKLVVVGKSENGVDYDFAMARYNTDGSLDNTFDSDGIVVTPIGNGGSASSVALQTDDKIVVAGNRRIGGNDDFAIVRYNSDGSMDLAFDTDGIVATAIRSGYDAANAVLVQNDGKIVVTGSSFNGNDVDFALVRYNGDGSRDSTFDADGIVITPIGGDDIGSSVCLQTDGKIVVGGSGNIGGYNDFVVARYNNALTTSVASIQDQPWTIEFYPNPTSGRLKIDWDGTANADLEIINALGEVVVQQTISSGCTLELPQKGIYVARIKAKNNVAFKRIVVQ